MILFLCYARTTLAHERGCETCLQHTQVGTRPICFSLVILRIDLAPDQSPLVPGPIADDDLAGVNLLNIWTAALSGPRLTSIESVEDIG